jgi:hypothetical protein
MDQPPGDDWGCLYQPINLPDLPGTVPAGSSALPVKVPNIVGASVDFQQACDEQHPGTFPVLGDPNDVRSCYCVPQDSEYLS